MKVVEGEEMVQVHMELVMKVALLVEAKVLAMLEV